ncbi:MAG: type 1 glutamine amidotransferase [Acidimicrobiia bacterium]
MRILGLVNDPLDPPGRLADVAREHGHELILVDLWDGAAIPDRNAFDAVVALGGAMGAYETEKYPYLVDEKEFLASVVHEGVPTLGICLGSQMLADALGGKAYLADRPEVSFERLILLVDDDPVVTALGSGRVALFHQDTWTLPPGARLMSANEYNHVFRFGSALGVQPHPELTIDDLNLWVAQPVTTEFMDRAGADLELVATITAAESEMAAVASRFFSAWFVEAEARIAAMTSTA